MKSRKLIFIVSIICILSLFFIGCAADQPAETESEGSEEQASEGASEDYPTRPVTLVNVYPAGGGLDIAARAVTAITEDYFPQPIVVEIRSGAGGALGTEYGCRAKPDGYTVIWTNLPPVSVYPIDGGGTPQVNYTKDDLIPIAQMVIDPIVVLVNPDLGFETMKDLEEYIRANPGELTFSSSGLWAATHLPTELWLKATGLTGMMEHLICEGGAPAMTALLTGDADVHFCFASVAFPHIQEGTAKALAVTTDERLEEIPDVPTLQEQGYDVSFVNWTGAFVPKGTPSHIVQTLEELFANVSQDDSYKALASKMGIYPEFLGSQQFKERIDKNFEEFNEIILELGE